MNMKPLCMAAALLAASCGDSQGDREYTHILDEVKVVERTPGTPDPEEEAELEYHWLQAFDRSDVGDDVDLDLGDGLFGDDFELRLEDLYVELWHDGAAGAKRLLRGIRDCDTHAAIRFGKPMFVQANELDPPSEWPFEVRYLEGDEMGLQAAELLRDHLRNSCDEDARELVREVIDEYGMVLRAVPALDYADDPGQRIALVLVLAPETGTATADAEGASGL